MISKVGAIFGECMARMSLAEKVLRASRESESGIFGRWIGEKWVGWGADVDVESLT